MADLQLSSFGDFLLGEWFVQPRLSRITSGNRVERLEPRCIDLLVFLARHPDEVYSRERLIDEVWQVEAVAENTLTHAIAALRKALGDDARNPRYIETIHRRGYRLLVTPGRVSDEESATNRTLSHYLVLEQIGAGGMGVVYRAHDERLDRDVAIKVLPEEVAADPDRLNRFEREAKALAALNHPNIATIYGFETLEFSESNVGAGFIPARSPSRADEKSDHPESVHFLVMELLEGHSLRELVSNDGITIGKAVEYARAIANGLAAAHEKKIIHRDLKPENVFLTKDGRIKILDFGLAKLGLPEADLTTETPTATLGTAPGEVLGTIPYMSPEQVQSQPADHRSDIFSLGVVLYEMLTGRRPFRGSTSVETAAAILKEDPEPISVAVPSVSPSLGGVVSKCLEKRPEDRFSSAHDLALTLGAIDTAPSGLPVVAGSIKPVFRRYSLIASGLVIALAASWWALTQLGSDESTQPSAPTFQSMSITPVTSLGTVLAAAVSPDGRQLVHVRSEARVFSIWVRQVATGSEVEVVPPQDLPIVAVDFTSDGEHVFFRRQDNRDVAQYGSIFRVPTLGGEVRRIVFDADSLPTFSPDGQRFAFRRGIPGRGTALMMANADGSEQREMAIAQRLYSPAWSPDGRTIATMLWSLEGWRPVAFDVDTGSRHAIADDVLFERLGGIVWLPEGDGLLVAGNIPGDDTNLQIWRLSTDEGTLERITNDPNFYFSLSLSADGKALSTVLVQRVGHLYVAPADEPNNIRQLTHGSRERVMGVDANGSAVVFQRMPGGKKWELWACDHGGNDLRRLSTDGTEIVPDRWGVSMADGEILFTANGADTLRQIWRIDESGKPPLQITATEFGANVPSLAPDGTWFAYTLNGKTGFDSLSSAGVWKQPAGDGDPILLDADAKTAAISPDGENVAIEIWRGDDDGVLHNFLEVIPVEGGAPVISTELIGDNLLRWHPSGQAVTYLILAGDGQVWRQPLDGGPPEQLTHFDHGRTASYSWSPDEEWLFLAREEITRDAVLIRDF